MDHWPAPGLRYGRAVMLTPFPQRSSGAAEHSAEQRSSAEQRGAAQSSGAQRGAAARSSAEQRRPEQRSSGAAEQWSSGASEQLEVRVPRISSLRWDQPRDAAADAINIVPEQRSIRVRTFRDW